MVKDNYWLWLPNNAQYRLKIRSEEKLFYIKNSKGDTLTTENTTIVNKETIIQDNSAQLWEKELVEENGYFTLKNPQSKKLLTAVSPHGFDIKGIIKQRLHLFSHLLGWLQNHMKNLGLDK